MNLSGTVGHSANHCLEVFRINQFHSDICRMHLSRSFSGEPQCFKGSGQYERV